MLYAIAQILIKFLGKLLLRLRVIGAEHVPETGPVLFAPNHVSYLDIPMLGAAVNRPLHFMGKPSLFQGRFVGRLYRALNGFPLERGPASRVGLMEAVRRLKAGRCVVMYPEGGRSLSGRLQNPMPGIGMVAALSGAKVIPVYVDGTDKVLPVGARWIRIHPVTVLIGEPLDFTEQIRQGNGKALYLQISRTVMEQIIKLEARAKALGSPRMKDPPSPGVEGRGEN